MVNRLHNGKLRLAIIGCGGIAGHLAMLARLNRRIHLVACCDRTDEAAARFAARFHIPHAYSDYAALLENSTPDAVYLAVPHDLHYGMLRAAIQAGRPVLCEKPVTRTLEEGQEIVRLAEAAGVRVGVNYQYRYDRGCYALATAARQGLLGELYYGHCNIPWQRDHSYFEQGPWRGKLAQAGGGSLLTQGSHAVDILLWAMDSRPRRANGMIARRKFQGIEVEDLGMGSLELENGALVQVCSSMDATPEQALTIELYGENGTAVYTNRPYPRVRFLGVRVRPAHPPVWGLHALQRSLEAFRRWVVQGQPYLTPAAEALPALAAVLAIYRSAQSGKTEAVFPG